MVHKCRIFVNVFKVENAVVDFFFLNLGLSFNLYQVSIVISGSICPLFQWQSSRSHFSILSYYPLTYSCSSQIATCWRKKCWKQGKKTCCKEVVELNLQDKRLHTRSRMFHHFSTHQGSRILEGFCKSYYSVSLIQVWFKL